MARRPPISDQRFAEIEKTIADVSEFLGCQDKYEACGVDCTDQRNACNFIQGQLQTILDVWRDGKTPPKTVPMNIHG